MTAVLSLVVGLLGVYLIYAGIAHSIEEYPYEQLWGVSFIGTLFVALAIRAVVAGRTRRVANFVAAGALVIFGLWLILAVQHGQISRRALVTEGLSFATGAKEAVLESFLANGRLPDSNAESGLAPAQTISAANVNKIEVAEGGIITVTFGGSERDRKLTGQTIVMVPTVREKNLAWDCRSGTMPMRYRPRGCR